MQETIASLSGVHGSKVGRVDPHVVVAAAHQAVDLRVCLALGERGEPAQHSTS